MYFERRPAKKGKKGYSWRVRFYYIDSATGLKKRYSKSGFDTKEQARKHAQKLLDEMEATGSLPAYKTVQEVWNEWLEMKTSDLAPNTQRIYQFNWKKYIAPEFAYKEIRSVTLSSLQSFFNGLDLSENACKSIKTTLLNIWKYARKAGYVSLNPVADIEINGKSKKPSENVLTLSEVQSIISAIDLSRSSNKESLKAFIWIGYYTGLRAGEILALEKADINMEARTLNVCKKVETDQTITERMKTASSKAVIPVCSILIELLSDYLDTLSDHDLIVSNRSGNLCTVSQIGNVLKKYSDKAGIENFHPHLLRHTFVTNLVRSGVDPKTASELARHSDISTTLNIYTQMDFSDMERAISTTFHEKPQKSPKNEIFQA